MSRTLRASISLGQRAGASTLLFQVDPAAFDAAGEPIEEDGGSFSSTVILAS
jgi:hypothetical protein